MNIQQRLDEILAENPDMQEYVIKFWYIKEGEQAPPGTTHTLRLGSMQSAERHLTIGVVATAKLAVILDILLAMVSTQGK